MVLRGWRAATIQNETLRVTILVGKGCDVVEFLYKPRDLDLTTRTQRGLRTREQTESTPWSEEGAFVNDYEGGWQEILPNGGPPASYAGASLPHHGEASRTPYSVSIVQDDPDRVEILCVARLAVIPLRIEKRFTLSAHSSLLTMSTTVVNETASPLPLMWGMHLAFGAPFVGPGSRITLAAGATFTADTEVVADAGRRTDGADGAWPFAHDPAGASVDLSVLPTPASGSDLHYLSPAEPWYRIASPDGGVDATVAWDDDDFAHLWFWQEFGGSAGYPWWGSEYLIGLEPWNCIPGAGLTRGVAEGSVPFLAPRSERSASVTVDVQERH